MKTAVTLLVVLAWPISTSAKVVEDFESTNAMSVWTFSPAPTPGGTGTLSRVSTGHSGHGARLVFDLTCTGTGPGCKPEYVRASMDVRGRKLVGQVLWLWTRSSATEPAVSVVDAAGVRRSLFMGTLPLSVPFLTSWVRRGAALDPAVALPLRTIEVNALRPEYSDDGDLLFDDIVLESSADAFRRIELDPNSPSAFRQLGNLPVLRDNLGVGMGNETDPQVWDAVAKVGMGFIRTPIRWHLVEKTQGVYDWSLTDTTVALAKQRNLKVLGILAHGNPLHTAGVKDPPTTAVQRDAFAAFAEAAAHRYRNDPVMFEVFNEPNISGGGWPGGAKNYALALKRTIAAIRKGNPNAVVTTAGVAAGLRPKQHAFIRAMLEDGAASGVNAVAVHTYPLGKTSPPEYQRSRWIRTRKLVSAHCPGVPVWDTEFGLSALQLAGGGNPYTQQVLNQQARLTVRKILSQWAIGVPRQVVFRMRDYYPHQYDLTYGLLHQNLTPKPLGVAIEQLSQAVGGGKPAAVYSGDDRPAGIHILKVTENQRVVIIAWAEIPGKFSLSVPTPPQTAHDLLGNPLTTAVVKGRTIVPLREEHSPIYVVFEPPGAISLAPSALTFSAEEKKGNPPSKTIAVSNSGGGTLPEVTTSIAYGSGADWLSVSRSGSGNNQSLDNSVNIAKLQPNTYAASVKVSAAGATNSPQSYTVSLTVTAKPEPEPKPDPTIALDPASLAFKAEQGSGNPPSRVIKVTNSGSKTLQTVSTTTNYLGGSGWLSVSRSGSGNSQSLDTSVDVAGLWPNTYTASVDVSAPGATNSPQSFTVSLTVTEKPDPDAGPGADGGGQGDDAGTTGSSDGSAGSGQDQTLPSDGCGCALERPCRRARACLPLVLLAVLGLWILRRSTHGLRRAGQAARGSAVDVARL